MKNTFRRFDVERSFYFESHDKEGNIKPDAPTVEEWKQQVIAEWTDFEGLNADECLIAFHDLDVYTDTREPKPLHAHGVIHFCNQRSEDSVAELMKVSSRKNCQHCKNYSGSVQYLIHVTQDAINDMKKIYPIETIQGYALDADGNKVQLTEEEVQKRMCRKTSKKKVEEEQAKSDLICDVMEGRKTISDVRDMYKTDEFGVGLNLLRFQKDKSMYLSAEREYLETCAEFYQTHKHPMSLIYITGNGGLGKSELAMSIANMIADKRGVHMVGAPGRNTTFDFAGGYNGQKVSFVDEAKPTSLPLEQFLSVFDSLHAKTVNSRHHDKAYFPDAVVFTASMEFEKFLYQCWKPYAQENANLSNVIRRNLISGNTSERDWHREYVFSQSDCANKFMQVRRRFAVLVNIRPDHFLEIRTFDKSANPAYSLLYTDSTFPFVEPFKLRNVLVYDRRENDATFNAQCQKASEAVLRAIDYYYESNGFTSPKDCLQPFDPEPQLEPEQEEQQADELTDFIEIASEECF